MNFAEWIFNLSSCFDTVWICESLKNVMDRVYGCFPDTDIYPGDCTLLINVLPFDMNE